MTHNENGSASLEAAHVIPGLVLLVAIIVAGGRLWYAHTGVTEVAHAAARAGSLADSPTTAHHHARQFAQRHITQWHTACTKAQITTDTSQFHAGGRLGSVRVHVTCEVPLADLFLPGIPGSVTFTAHADSIVETHRGRS